MPDKNYSLMTLEDVLECIRIGYYDVDINKGFIYNRKQHRLSPYFNEHGHLFIRVYRNSKRKAIAVHRLVWMAATDCIIPESFEVHHRNKIADDNRFCNLICVHKLDHMKFHEDMCFEEEIPF